MVRLKNSNESAAEISKQLADEQWEDGSWGRFHSQDSKTAIKQKFVTTENALGQARQLSLSKDDPIIAKCLRKLERYVRGDETWTDNVEKHKDGGKGHLFCRPYMSAADYSGGVTDPDYCVMKFTARSGRITVVSTVKILRYDKLCKSGMT